MKGFYNVTKQIKEALEAEPFVNTVTFGSIDDVDLNKQTIFPLSHITVNNTTVGSKTLTFNISILSMDIVKPIFKSSLKEDRLLLLSRFFIVSIGILSLLLALILKGVISSLLLGYTVYTSGLVFPILLGFYRHKLKLNRAGAISGMMVGGGLALIGKIMGWNFFGFSAGLYGFFLSGLTIIIVSRFSR